MSLNWQDYTKYSCITATALLDLIYLLLDSLWQFILTNKKIFYTTLNYSGSIVWDPILKEDELVLNLFNQDQTKQKIDGYYSLGPHASSYLENKAKEENIFLRSQQVIGSYKN